MLATMRAAIVVVAPTASTAGSVTITQDITFTITTAVPGDILKLFVLEEWVTFDGGQNVVTVTPPFSISLNGGAPQTAGSGDTISDNGYPTPSDGYLALLHETPAFAAGDTVTLKAGSHAIGAISGFNPQATQTFTGDIFMSTSNGPISNTVAAPEPATGALLAMAAGALLGRRSRARA